MDEYIKKEDILIFIERIKCDKNIPKNYGILLDIMRYIRKMPTFDLESAIEQIEGIMDDDSIRFCDQAVRRAVNILKSAANATNGKNGG